MKSTRGYSTAFTLIELLILLAAIVVAALIILPGLAKARIRGGPTCSSNLRRIGFAFSMWEIDHQGRYPMEVSIANGGAREAAATNLAFVFQVMSNYFNTPKILACPGETKRISATNFFRLANKDISYFAGLDASRTNPASILSGDRNITNGLGVRTGIQSLVAAYPSGWTPTPHGGSGNILFADGSVRFLSTPQLREAITNTGFATNRLLMP
jgi:prepilin-type processing-associated H-X9-DG protein